MLANYLADACGAKPGKVSASRTSLYGLQRPPVGGGATIVRVGEGTSVDDAGAVSVRAYQMQANISHAWFLNYGDAPAAPYLLPFLLTNARDSLTISAHPSRCIFVYRKCQSCMVCFYGPIESD